MAVVLAGLAGACSQPVRQPAPTPGTRPDIVLISIDTLRADRVGVGLTPVLDALAARGARFLNARTVAPLTLPAHVTLMTGVRPPTHGVRLNGVHRFEGAPAAVASRLREAGYRTAAFVGAYVLDRRFGLDQGFDTYDDEIPRRSGASERLEAERRGEVVVDRALAWLRAQTATAAARESSGSQARAPHAGPPLFLWVHLYDPHAPYEPPAEFLARAGGKAYDGEVAYADAQVGRLLDTLDRSGRARAVVVVAGDHGESLGEHGEPTHGMLLYESAMRAPLIIAGPGVPAAARAEPVSLVDVAPTILRVARLEPSGTSEGRDLLAPPASEAPAIYGETEYPRLAGWSPLASLTGARWKLVDAPVPELYDVSADPGEETNLAASQPAVVNGMRARLGELRAHEATRPAGTVAPDAAARLRALGYVAGPVTGAPSGGGENPAAMMPVWAAFESALGDLSRGNASRALGQLASLAREHPDAPVFQTTFARALADRGRHREALTIYRRAVARWPDDSMLFHDLAVAARASGERDEARRAERAALALDDRNALAHNGLGLLLVEAGEPRAAAAFERACALDPTNAQYLVHLGNAHRDASDATAAGDAYRRALAIDGSLADALNGLAVVLVQSGRPREAIPLLERALAREPGLVEARLNLGIAAQEAGDLARARTAYAEVLRAPARFARERRAAAALLRSLPATR